MTLAYICAGQCVLAEAACYRLERTLVGYFVPHRGRGGKVSEQCRRVNETRSVVTHTYQRYHPVQAVEPHRRIDDCSAEVSLWIMVPANVYRFLHQAHIRSPSFTKSKACHDYESSECETARQHKVAGVACYRPRVDADGVGASNHPIRPSLQLNQRLNVID